MMHSFKYIFAALLLGLIAALPAQALDPGEKLEDPALQERARALYVELRCLVCQNQSIDDSEADLARDMRALVREKLQEGLSDQKIREFLVARYGEFVLFSPPVNSRTGLLWFGPLIALLAGSLALLLFFRQRRLAKVEHDPLSEEERQRLARILQQERQES